MTTAVTAFPFRVYHIFSYSISEFKIQKISNYFFSFLHTLFAASILFYGRRIVSLALTNVLSIPFFACAYYFAEKGKGIWDLHNPKDLERLQADIIENNLTLLQVVERWGWKNLFFYRLVKPSCFEAAFLQKEVRKTLKTLFQMYKEAKGALTDLPGSGFTLPSLHSYKEIFLSEIRDKSPLDILDYGISDLFLHAFITEEQKEKLTLLQQEYTDAINRFQARLQTLNSYPRTTAHIPDILKKHLPRNFFSNVSLENLQGIAKELQDLLTRLNQEYAIA